MLSLETCQRLRDAGFDCSHSPDVYIRRAGIVMRISYLHSFFTDGASTLLCACPTLEELLEAVDGMTTKTLTLDNAEDGWTCSIGDVHQTNGGYGFTDPSEAVAALWLRLKVGDEQV